MKITPSQDLVLEVLAARERLGERLWTFPSGLSHHLRPLEDAGLIRLFSGIVDKTVRASLTDAGRDTYLAASTTKRLATMPAPDQPDAEATLRLLADTRGPWNLLMTAPVGVLADGRMALVWAMGEISRVLDAHARNDSL